ncbi:hypothetical protein ACJ73_00059 [Blastomyces percursus]|uniref:5'-deoxynucleotidase n=1 Tax=Blastomyces percursus TaxID=1658174 RepID=A0A1J9RKT1_9EURO|nr:hypothetical protein ACJ73_00059 [Blastomyces percursus]
MDQSQHFSAGASPLEFLHVVGRLKRVKRAGWVIRGVADAESVADHTFRMTLMCMMFEGYSNFNITKCVYMAMFHDIGEAIVGDITPFDGINKDEKYLRERLAIMFLSCLVHHFNPKCARSIMDLWLEFEKGTTKEAILVRDFDRLECLVQAFEYERSQGVNLQDFLTEADRIRTPEVKSLAKSQLLEREAFLARKTEHIIVIFVLGGPGVGKGTQCSKLAQDLGFEHISVGDLLREEGASTKFSDFISESMKESIIIPAQLTVHLLESKIRLLWKEGKQRFLIDGFPRSMEQILEFEEQIQQRNATLFLDCQQDAMIERLTKRASMSGRIDDNPESIQKRIETFLKENETIVNHLRNSGPVKIVKCDAPVDEVYESTKAAVEGIISQMESDRWNSMNENNNQ